MSLIPRLESRFGRFAVPNLTLFLIAGQVFLYIANMFAAARNDDLLQRIQLLPAEVLQGEVWRVVTFLFDPPTANPLFAFMFWYLFYLFGTTLEHSWGTFRYNIFLLIGYMATVATSLVIHGLFGGPNIAANNGFVYGTIFLAFARLYPDFVLSIFFVLPVKVRWLAVFQWCIYGMTFLAGDWVVRGTVAASVLNYLLFFGRDLWRDLQQGHRRMGHQARTLKSPQRLVHSCAVCGLTSDDAPQTQFRYCSRCEGERCYCPEHLQNHEHATRRATEAVSERAR